MNFAYLTIAIAFEVIATSALKATEGFTRLGPSVVTVIGYALAFYFLSLTLRTMPVGIAYAVWSGAGIVLITAIGWLYFRQSIDAPGLAGISLILAGVLVVNLFSRSMGHKPALPDLLGCGYGEVATSIPPRGRQSPTLNRHPISACSMEHFFETSRLIARRFTPLDLDAFVAMRADPQVARFQSWEDFTHKDGRAFLESITPRNPGEPGWFQFALESKDDRRFVGDCGLKTFETDPRLAQIGYTITRPHWSQGYATEAVRGLLEYAFANFPIHRIIASVDPRHVASVRVLEKAGLVKEGHFRQSEWFKGAWADDAIYAVLSSDANP